MSVYNGDIFLQECIDGINKQTFKDYEIIVVDDGSSDRTPDILSNWRRQNDRVHIITRPNGGLTTALNLAISKSKGKYLARHDADDISSPYRIEQQVSFLESKKDAVLIGTHVVEFSDTHSLISLYCPPDDPKFIRDTLRTGENPLVHGSIMFRKEVYEKLSEGYRFRYCQDYDLYLRLSAFGNIRIVPEVLYCFRNHLLRSTIQAKSLKPRIVKLIMQVNGLIPWDSDCKSIIENYQNNEPLWKILEEHIIRNTPTSKGKMKAQYYMSLIGDELEKNKKITALFYALKAMLACPTWWKTWFSLPYACIGIILPRSLIGQWRGKSTIARYRKPCHGTHISDVIAVQNSPKNLFIQS